MRKRDKIENYLFYLMRTKEIGECCESTKSRYFKVNEKVLRVSDHIGPNSSGCISIIVGNEMGAVEGVYGVHSHSTGQFQLMTYEEVKELCRSFFRISAFLYDISGYSCKSWKKEQEASEESSLKKNLSVQQSENAKLKKEIEVLKASSTAANIAAYQKKVAEIQSERDKLRNSYEKYRLEVEEKMKVLEAAQKGDGDCVKVISEPQPQAEPFEYKSFEQLQTSSVLGIDFDKFDEKSQRRLLQDFATFFSCNYTNNKKDLIFGYPKGYFTDRQVQQFQSVVNNYNAANK